MNKSFYPTPPPSVHNYLNYTDFFILIQSKEIRKRAIAVITTIPITAGTPLATTAKTAAMPRKGAITVITAIPVTAGTPLTTTTETAVTPETRSNQIDPLKGAGNTLNLKVRFYNDIIVIKESNDIDIITLNDKTAMPETTTLEISQPMNQILKCEEIIHL